MTLPYAGKQYVVFTDFDGTITTEDSNDHMTDNLGFGREERRRLNVEIYHNRVPFRDAFRSMLESVNEKYTFDECREIVKKNIKLDPGFAEFFKWTKSVGIPVVVVSSGMEPIIRAIFANLIGEEDAKQLDIISNYVDVREDGHFSVRFRHPESHFGHDKSKALRPYAELPKDQRPGILFCGDGVSDLSAAGEGDVLFAKVIPGGSNDLARHCDKEKIPYLPFLSFTQVLEHTRELVDGKVTLADLGSGKVPPKDDVVKAMKEKPSQE